MKTPFKLKSGNTTPFKQMGSSPLKQGIRPAHLRSMSPTAQKWLDIFPGVDDPGLMTTYKSGEKPSTITTFSPGKTFESRYGKKRGSLGLKLSAKGKQWRPNIPWQPQHTYTGIKGKLNVGKGTSSDWAGFKGSVSGSAGLRDLFSPKSWKNPMQGKTAYEGRVEAGIGSRKWNISGFGEHTSKRHLKGGGTRVGLSGKFGIGKFEAGYNIKTKKPYLGVGFTL